jgi:hypothetical protein
MILFTMLMKGLDAVEAAKEESIDNLIERTKQQGLPNGQNVCSGWAGLYECLKEKDNA